MKNTLTSFLVSRINFIYQQMIVLLNTKQNLQHNTDFNATYCRDIMIFLGGNNIKPQKQFYKSSSYSSSKTQNRQRTNPIDLTGSLILETVCICMTNCLHYYVNQLIQKY